MTVRTRFAPSPTGSLHVGGVRTALYCLLYARKTGGTFVLRIEDTDQARSTEEAAAGIQRDLQWCGLMWDEGPQVEGPYGPYFQSRRLDTYNGVIEQLLASGHAYEAWDSRDELDLRRKEAEAKKETFRYKYAGPVSAEQIAAWRAEGRVPVVRLKSPTHDITVHDVILGDVVVKESELEDIVLRKADGFPTYHFAVVVDDHLMRIDQILRGQEHLMNTPKHLGIFEALGWEPPKFGHMPLIFNPAGQKMSKREKAQKAREAARDAIKANGGDQGWLAEASGVAAPELASFMKKEHDKIPVAEAIARSLNVALPMIEVMDFRKAGYLPEALVNYLALLGWSPGEDRELMTLPEMIELFSLERVQKTAARFDPTKLKWMNGEYLRRLPIERVLQLMDQWLEVQDSPIRGLSAEKRKALHAMYKDRVDTFVEIEQAGWFFFRRPTSFDDKAVKKHLDAAAVDRLRQLRGVLAEVAWDAASVEAACKPIGGDNMGHVAQPLRVALTGTAVSPPIFDTIVFLDRDEVLARVDHTLATFGDRA